MSRCTFLILFFEILALSSCISPPKDSRQAMSEHHDSSLRQPASGEENEVYKCAIASLKPDYVTKYADQGFFFKLRYETSPFATPMYQYYVFIKKDPKSYFLLTLEGIYEIGVPTGACDYTGYKYLENSRGSTASCIRGLVLNGYIAYFNFVPRNGYWIPNINYGNLLKDEYDQIVDALNGATSELGLVVRDIADCRAKPESDTEKCRQEILSRAPKLKSIYHEYDIFASLVENLKNSDFLSARRITDHQEVQTVKQIALNEIAIRARSADFGDSVKTTTSGWISILKNYCIVAGMNNTAFEAIVKDVESKINSGTTGYIANSPVKVLKSLVPLFGNGPIDRWDGKVLISNVNGS